MKMLYPMGTPHKAVSDSAIYGSPYLGTPTSTNGHSTLLTIRSSVERPDVSSIRSLPSGQGTGDHPATSAWVHSDTTLNPSLSVNEVPSMGESIGKEYLTPSTKDSTVPIPKLNFDSSCGSNTSGGIGGIELSYEPSEETEVQRLVKLVTYFVKKCDMLEKTVNTQAEKITALEGKITTLERVNTDLTGKITTLELELADAHTRLEVVEKDGEMLHEAVDVTTSVAGLKATRWYRRIMARLTLKRGSSV